MQLDRTQTTEEAATLNAMGAEMRRLWAVGVAGRATITGVQDTGRRLAGNTVLDLDLLVSVPHHAPYHTTLRVPIGGSDLTPYGPGAQYNVKVDPLDPHRVAFSA
jgi:hypothetical protein